MRIFEIDKGKFINLDTVFKFELASMDDSNSIFWKFYSSYDETVTSKEFIDQMDAITWLNMTIARAEGAGEIILL
jgi:hypothetical protein